MALSIQHYQCLAPLTELLDNEIEEGDSVADLELFVDEADQLAVALVVPVFQVSLEVVPQTLLLQPLVPVRRGGVFNPHVDEVQQLKRQEFCTQKTGNTGTITDAQESDQCRYIVF